MSDVAIDIGTRIRCTKGNGFFDINDVLEINDKNVDGRDDGYSALSYEHGISFSIYDDNNKLTHFTVSDGDAEFEVIAE